MLPRLSVVARKFSTSIVRRNEPGGIPGVNIPFSIDNPLRLTVVMALYLGSGMAVPFLCVRHQLTK